MKHPLTLACLCIALVVSGFAFSQSPPVADQNERRFELLQKDVADSRFRVEQLAAELKQTRALLESTLKYLEAQAKSAQTLAATLDDSERAGFIYGINPDSRQILLRGWRETLASAQTGIPTPPVVPVEKPAVKKP